MRTFVEKFIGEESITELDLMPPFYETPSSFEEKEIRNEVMVPHHRLSFTKAPSMDLDTAIGILNDLKEKGADRIYFAAHGDHHGYYFYGTKLVEI